MNVYKVWKMSIILGGIIGLCMIPLLDVLIYQVVETYPVLYPHSPNILPDALATLAQVGLIVKYWLVAVGIVALAGWFFKIDGSEYKKPHKQD